MKGGEKIKVDAPYERLPLFVREGTILPIGPEIQYTDQKPADLITLFIYSGRNAGFTLYEDEGNNYNYEKGSYSTIGFSYNEEKKEMTINERKGEFSGMLKIRKFNIVLISKEKPVTFEPESANGQTVIYSGNKIVVNL
jgi:alpha-D-xyloside xylohydrolase